MHKIIFVILSIFVFVTLLFAMFTFKYDPISAAKCFINGGSYEARVAALGTPVVRYCVFEYSDGGQKCTSSDECQGFCLVSPETELISTGSISKDYVGGYGRCEATNRWTGCFTGSVEVPLSYCE